MRDASERWRDHGFDLDFAELIYLGDRNEAAAYLGDHGWELTRNSVKELFAANGLPPMDEKARRGRQLRRAAVRQRRAQGGPTMSRTDTDSWDLASSVGATATMVAAARALVSREPDALIDDPFAAPLVRAVGLDFFTRLVDGDIPLANLEGDGPRFMANWIAVRTRFFDDFFVNAGAAGIRQAVILAAGPGLARLPIAVGRGHYRLRDRPTESHRVQDHDDDGDRCDTESASPYGQRRPARGLACRVAA